VILHTSAIGSRRTQPAAQAGFPAGPSIRSSRSAIRRSPRNCCEGMDRIDVRTPRERIASARRSYRSARARDTPGKKPAYHTAAVISSNFRSAASVAGHCFTTSHSDASAYQRRESDERALANMKQRCPTMRYGLYARRRGNGGKHCAPAGHAGVGSLPSLSARRSRLLADVLMTETSRGQRLLRSGVRCRR